MSQDDKKVLNRVFACVMSLVLVFIVMVFSVALYKHCTAYAHDESDKTYNVDSIRRAQRALTDSLREAQCVTLEDSIHHFEDGY